MMTAYTILWFKCFVLRFSYRIYPTAAAKKIV